MRIIKWNLLTQSLQLFWDLDLLEIKENKKSVNENVADEIKLEENRYTVKLAFQENHPVILENYSLSAKRLNELKIRLHKDILLLQEYNDVIKEQLELGIIEKIDTPNVSGERTYTLLKSTIIWFIQLTYEKADTEKVYLQMNVHWSHRDHLHFLWFNATNRERPIIER